MMNRLVLVLVLAFAPTLHAQMLQAIVAAKAPAAGATPAVVGSPKIAMSTVFNQPTISTAATSHTAGNRLVVAVHLFSSATCASPGVVLVTNTALDTFTSFSSCVENAASGLVILWFQAASTAGNASDVVTATLGNSNFVGIAAWEISGSSGIDVSTPASGTGSTKTVTTSAYTTTHANEVQLGALLLDSPETPDVFTFGGASGTLVSSGARNAGMHKAVSAIQTGITANMQWTAGAFEASVLSVVTVF